jgi:adenylate cyclase class IV
MNLKEKLKKTTDIARRKKDKIDELYKSSILLDKIESTALSGCYFLEIEYLSEKEQELLKNEGFDIFFSKRGYQDIITKKYIFYSYWTIRWL